METFSTRGLKSLFSYPLRKAGWQNKMGILIALFFGGMIVPLAPTLFAFGYLAEVIRRAAREDDPELPEWKNWGELFWDGLRLWGASLFYTLPLLVIFGTGWGLYMISTLGMTTANDGNIGGWMVLLFGSLGAMFCSLICGTILAVAGLLIAPAALTHMVVKRSFGALFQVGEWWKYLRANLGGYLIFFVLLGGMVFATQLLTSVIAWTFVLMPLLMLVSLLISPYMMLICGLIFGRVYREAEETLALTAAAAE